MELAIMGIMSLLSLAVGYNLFKGGKEIDNHNIRMAGIYWVLMVIISVTTMLILTKGFGM